MVTPKKKNAVRVAEVLCDSGQTPFNVKTRETLSQVTRVAARVLDDAYLHNIVVVRGDDNKYYVGQFCFRLDPVSKKEAERVARDFTEEDSG